MQCHVVFILFLDVETDFSHSSAGYEETARRMFRHLDILAVVNLVFLKLSRDGLVELEIRLLQISETTSQHLPPLP